MFTILIGKSGSGKDTIKNELISSIGCTPVISSTCREKRPNEKDGVDYNFLSRGEFESKINDGTIFEYRAYSSSNGLVYYGSEKIDLDKSKDYVKVLDVEGAKEYVRTYGRENCFVVEVEASDEVRFNRAFIREFGTEITNDEEMLANKENFCKEWEARLADDNKRFSLEETEGVVNFRLTNESSLNDVIETFTNALNTYDYEMQMQRDMAHLHTSFRYPLLYLEARNEESESDIYVKNKSDNFRNNIAPAHIEGLESLETF